MVEEIERVCRERPEISRLLTLTLDPSAVPRGEDPHDYITGRWNALRTRLKREIGDFSYIWVREEQESGNPHLHVLVSRFLPQQAVKWAWSDLGGGEVVDIRQIDRVDKAAHVIGTYLTKDALHGFPEGTRRYGSSADIELQVRNSGGSGEYELVLRDRRREVSRDEPVVREVEGEDFALQLSWGGPVPPPLKEEALL